MPAGHDDGLSRAHPVAWRRIEGPKKLIGIDVGNVVRSPADGTQIFFLRGALLPRLRPVARASVHAARLNLSGYTAPTAATLGKEQSSDGRVVAKMILRKLTLPGSGDPEGE